MNYGLIELSENSESEDYESVKSNDSLELSDIESYSFKNFENKLIPIEYYESDEVKTGLMKVTLVKKDDNIISDKKLKHFIKFCVSKNLFDDTFYDYSNIFSIIGTKLSTTFEKISKNKYYINKKDFVREFKKKYKYTGDINYIYNIIDMNKNGEITWIDFKEFFLPFVKNITL